MGAEVIDDIPDIDEAQLTSSEHVELYIFQYLSNTERSVLAAPVAVLKAEQGNIEKTVLAITTSPIPAPSSQGQAPYKYPSPGRAIRNIAGRILVDIYTRGETRTAFDTIQAYIKAASEPPIRGVDRDVWRIAAFSCVGDLMEKFGSQYMSLVSEVATASLKCAKSSSSPLLRYHALNALRKTMLTARKAVTDSAMKDTLKQMRNYLTDKSLAIQRIAADVLRAAHSSPTQISQAEIDSVITSCVKSLETADGPTRASLGKLVAHMLKSTQTERAPQESSTAKKDAAKAKAAGANGEEAETDSVSTTEPAKPLKSPGEMLALLSVHFNKPQASRKTRVGLMQYYNMTLIDLKPRRPSTPLLPPFSLLLPRPSLTPPFLLSIRQRRPRRRPRNTSGRQRCHLLQSQRRAPQRPQEQCAPSRAATLVESAARNATRSPMRTGSVRRVYV